MVSSPLLVYQKMAASYFNAKRALPTWYCICVPTRKKIVLELLAHAQWHKMF